MNQGLVTFTSQSIHYICRFTFKWIFLLTIHEIEDNKIRNISTGVMRKKAYS